MVCFQNGIEEPSWYPLADMESMSIEVQLQLNCLFFWNRSTVLENMSIQWKTCQGWTSRYIFVDMLTKCQLLVILVRYHPSGQVQPSLQLGGPRISLTSTFGKVIFILKSDLVNWVNWFILVYYWLMTAPMYRLSAVLICVDVCCDLCENCKRIP